MALKIQRFGPQQQNAPQGFLKTDGKRIRDQNGTGAEVLLRGINLGGLFLIEPWILGIDKTDEPPIEDEWTLRNTLISRFGDAKCRQLLDAFYDVFIQDDDLAYLQGLGINTIRLPINYRLLQNEDGSWVKDKAGKIDFGKIDNIVLACKNRGIYVLLDLHGAPGSQSKERHSGRVNFNKLLAPTPEGEDYRKRTSELWRAIAEHYKNNTTICGYDLLNEPSEPKDIPSRNALWEIYDHIYQAIRSVDKNHIIMMEAVWDWASLPIPSKVGWENVVYQFHYYDVLSNKDPAIQKAFIDKKILEGRPKREQYQVPVMIGEFTCLNYLPTWDHYLEKFNQEGWSWTLWTYKARGPSAEWGLFHAPGNIPDLPKFKTDSFAVLSEKLSAYSTLDHYKLNIALAELIKKNASLSNSGLFISNISPETIRPGDDFWIKGMNFGEAQKAGKVLFGDLSLPIISWSDTAIRASVPKNQRARVIAISVQRDKKRSNARVLRLTDNFKQK